MGESASDWLAQGGVSWLSVPQVIALDAAILIVALLVQFRVRRYVAWAYWSAVAAVSIMGTVVADVVYLIGVPLWATVTLSAVALTLTFIGWYRSEKTLSIHSIVTRRREVFYWLTVLFTFALGTAVGDLTAVTFNMGFLASGIAFAALITTPAIAYRRFELNATVAFWSAYVLTRPLGASFADWFGASPERTGLGWGAGWVTLVATVIIVALIGYSTAKSKRKPQKRQAPTTAPKVDARQRRQPR